MKSKMDIIEAHLQALIENRFTWLPWRNRQPRLARKIVEALRHEVFSEVSTEPLLPNQLTLRMQTENASAWESHPEWMTWLNQTIQDCVFEAGASFVSQPVLLVMGDDALSEEDLIITAAFTSSPDAGSTAAMILDSAAQPFIDNVHSPAAFLITNGSQIIPLSEAVVNIGRREDNQLVLDDMRVSRSHAQIRKARGQHVLFDLDSTGGTFVNGARITQHLLSPGDVISFAGVSVIYGMDSPDDQTPTGTSPAGTPQ